MLLGTIADQCQIQCQKTTNCLLSMTRSSTAECFLKYSTGTNRWVDNSDYITQMVALNHVPTVCPDGYTFKLEFQKCYRHYDLIYSQSDAQAKCVSDGGSLVNIQSQAENDYVYNTIKTSTYAFIGYTWTTATWAKNPNNLKLLALTEGNTFTKFYTGQGDDTNQPCTGIGWHPGEWDDIECSINSAYNLRFICNTNPESLIQSQSATPQPTRQPTRQPSSQPSTQPSRQPSGQPTSQPSSQPSTQPTSIPAHFEPTSPSSKPFIFYLFVYSFLIDIIII